MITGTAKIAVTLGIVAFLLVGSFGMSHIGMTTQMDGMMSDCPFTPGVAICEMSPLQMIAASQGLLNLPQQKDLASILLLLLSAALVLAVFKPLLPPRLALLHATVPRREYLPFSNPLQELFSNGILNPKLY